MTFAETRCDHDWQWLPRPEYHFGLLGQLTTAENVYCAGCGKRAWAHGTMPDARPAVRISHPTTGRS